MAGIAADAQGRRGESTQARMVGSGTHIGILVLNRVILDKELVGSRQAAETAYISVGPG